MWRSQISNPIDLVLDYSDLGEIVSWRFVNIVGLWKGGNEVKGGVIRLRDLGNKTTLVQSHGRARLQLCSVSAGTFLQFTPFSSSHPSRPLRPL